MPDYLQHGRRHAPGGSDPIPGLGSGSLPVAVAEYAAALTVTAASTTHFSWSSVTISDSSVYSWTSGTQIHLLQTGLYMAWLMIAADGTWPTISGTGFVRWAPITGFGSGLGGFQPFGGHPSIDTFAPTGYEAGELVASSLFQNIDGVPDTFQGQIDNTANSASFTTAEPSYMVIARLCDAVTIT